jgi:hypothetical protein
MTLLLPLSIVASAPEVSAEEPLRACGRTA